MRLKLGVLKYRYESSQRILESLKFQNQALRKIDPFSRFQQETAAFRGYFRISRLLERQSTFGFVHSTCPQFIQSVYFKFMGKLIRQSILVQFMGKPLQPQFIQYESLHSLFSIYFPSSSLLSISMSSRQQRFRFSSIYFNSITCVVKL